MGKGPKLGEKKKFNLPHILLFYFQSCWYVQS